VNTWKGTIVRIRDIIKIQGTEVISVSEDANISDAAKLMRRFQIGVLVVLTSDGKFKGIMSEREIVVALAQCGKCALELHVRELTMLGGPVVSPAHSVADAMQIMTERRARHLPVVDKRAVVGLIGIEDLVKVRLGETISEDVVLHQTAEWPRTAAA
jgi:CBS domain-containing protein